MEQLLNEGLLEERRLEKGEQVGGGPVEQDGLEVSVIALREVRTGRRTAG